MMKRIFAIVALIMVSSILSAQEVYAEYEKLFKEGIEAFDNHNYKTALSKFKRVVNMPETSQSLRSQAGEFIKTCNKHLNAVVAQPKEQAKEKEVVVTEQKKEVVHTLTLSPMNLSLPAAGGTKEITVESTSDWTIMVKPGWCKVIETADNYLKIWCDENSTQEAREGELAFSANNGKVVGSVHLFQEKGMNRSGHVYFRTVPGNAMIEIPDCSVYGISSRAHKLTAGTHEVRVHKEGYEPLDTTIVVPVSEENKTVVVDLALNPLFGILLPDIEVEDAGRREQPDVTFRVNRKIVDISNPADGLSFDDDGGVIYNVLYKGGRIPLLPGTYEISASAEGYEDFKTYVTIEKGKTCKLKCGLKYVSGWLTVLDDGNAEDAIVVADEGFSCNVGEKMRLPVGEYIVEVRKDGYMLDDGIIEAVIEEGKESMYQARMTRMVDCMVSTEVTGETVLINGDKVPYQHPVHVIPLAEGNSYIIEVRKNGYWTYRDSVGVSVSDSLIDMRGIVLEQVHPMHIKYDEPNVKISLYAKKDTVKRDYAGVIPLNGKDTTLNVPYGNYKLQLSRRYEPIKGRKTAYAGNIRFSEKRTSFTVQTWSRANFLALGGDLNLLSNKPDVSYPVAGSAFVGQFKLWNGLSTSILKASSFNTSGYDFPYKDEETVQPSWSFGASCLFLNYDFRIGGGFCHYGDIAFLLSYAWNPPLTFAVPLTHFSGHEAFAGLELSSRIKVFNVNFKVGTQYVNGKFNCYNVPSDKYTNTKDCFTEHKFDRIALVASVGFSLGGRDAKGRNILRLW